jgi:hypothetical protein
MSLRSPLLATAALLLAGVAAGPAAAQSPTDHPAPGATPGSCVDTAAPTSTFTRKAARRAARKRILRGTAGDIGCGLNRVQIAVSRKKAGKCRLLTPKKKLGHRIRCSRHHWLPVRGTTKWSFRLPKRLPKGAYVIRTRAVDFAGNVQRTHAHRIKLR